MKYWLKSNEHCAAFDKDSSNLGLVKEVGVDEVQTGRPDGISIEV